MNYTIYDYLGLFFLYAFLGWLLETTVAAVRKKHMVNRGFLNGPLCAIYGITAVFMTRYLYELQSSPVFLFLGCMIIATAAEWIAGHVLERIGHGKWWDYSNKKWNMDGYICLQYSVLWGILRTVLALKFGNHPLALPSSILAPNGVMHITSCGSCSVVLVVDAIGSYAVLRHITKKMPRISRHERPDRRLHQTAFRPPVPLPGSAVSSAPTRSVQPDSEAERENRNRSLRRRMQLSTKSSFCSSSAHFWAILQKPYSAASPPVSG